MASQHFKCKEELPITDTEEAEIEQIALGSYFVDNNDILNREIKEEATEVKPISEYGVPNECPKNNENRKFYDTNPDSSKFEVPLRYSVEGSTESKFSLAHFWENKNCNGLASELAKVNHLNDEDILKKEDEDHSECKDDSLTNNVESKTNTLKNEDDIDVIYENVKREICEIEASGKGVNSFTDILMGAEIGPNFSHEHSINFWENKKFSGLASELAIVNHFNGENILKKEDENHSECNDDSLTNNVELKMKTLKNEDDIDVIYEDVKREICEKEASGKSVNGSYPNSFTDILIGTEIGAEIGPTFSHELSIDSETWPQRNIEEDGTSVERDNDKRKEPTVTIDSNVLLHERNHTGEKLFQCKICPKSFNQIGNLKRHERVHTGEKPFQCQICSKSFTAKDSLLYHEKIHTGEKQFHCKICPKSFHHKRGLAKHDIIHTGQKPLQCKICPKSFNAIGSLKRHERVHTREKPFQCKICSKRFTTKESLLYHDKIHSGERPFQCKICPKSFISKQKLLHHERSHTGEKPFQCKLCSKGFTLRHLLLLHERNHTGEKLYQCKVCSKSFNQIANLTRHERVHSGEKPFQCEVCSKSFTCFGSLNTHERVHTGEKAFQCKMCPKSFTYIGNLTRHERVHTMGKPFQCKICTKSFTEKASLLYHEKIHTGEKPFQCQICSKSFIIKKILVRHERIHTGEKPF